MKFMRFLNNSFTFSEIFMTNYGHCSLYNASVPTVSKSASFRHKLTSVYLQSTRNLSHSHEGIQMENIKPSTKVLKIAIIGVPNSGKSTFINQIVGRKVFAVSSKVHTTRARARAILNLDDTQVIFLDTPGLVTQTELDKHHLENEFIRAGELAITEAHIVGVMHDVGNRFTRGKLDPKVLRLLNFYPSKHSVLILNKVDEVKKKRYLLDLANKLTCNKLMDQKYKDSLKYPKLSEMEVMKEVKMQSGWPHFNQVFMVSALEGSGVGEVMQYLMHYAKPGEWLFPESVYTDQRPEKLICNSVKARMLDHLPQEVPYNCHVKLELFHELDDGTLMAVVLITCPNVRCEKMTIKRIRLIAQETEAELRNTFQTQFLVKLVVQSADQ